MSVKICYFEIVLCFSKKVWSYAEHFVSGSGRNSVVMHFSLRFLCLSHTDSTFLCCKVAFFPHKSLSLITLFHIAH